MLISRKPALFSWWLPSASSFLSLWRAQHLHARDGAPPPASRGRGAPPRGAAVGARPRGVRPLGARGVGFLHGLAGGRPPRPVRRPPDRGAGVGRDGRGRARRGPGDGRGTLARGLRRRERPGPGGRGGCGGARDGVDAGEAVRPRVEDVGARVLHRGEDGAQAPRRAVRTPLPTRGQDRSRGRLRGARPEEGERDLDVREPRENPRLEHGRGPRHVAPDPSSQGEAGEHRQRGEPPQGGRRGVRRRGEVRGRHGGRPAGRLRARLAWKHPARLHRGPARRLEDRQSRRALPGGGRRVRLRLRDGPGDGRARRRPGQRRRAERDGELDPGLERRGAPRGAAGRTA